MASLKPAATTGQAGHDGTTGLAGVALEDGPAEGSGGVDGAAGVLDGVVVGGDSDGGVRTGSLAQRAEDEAVVRGHLRHLRGDRRRAVPATEHAGLDHRVDHVVAADRDRDEPDVVDARTGRVARLDQVERRLQLLGDQG
jgi:hypothetical protein